MMSQLSVLIFQWENHCECALETSPFVCISAGIHAGTPNTVITSEPLYLFLNPISVPVTYIHSYNVWGAVTKWLPKIRLCNEQPVFDEYRCLFSKGISSLCFFLICFHLSPHICRYMCQLRVKHIPHVPNRSDFIVCT